MTQHPFLDFMTAAISIQDVADPVPKISLMKIGVRPS